jgi:hypothetical protein
MLFRFEVGGMGSVFPVSDEGLLVTKVGAENTMSAVLLSPAFPDDVPVAAAAIRIEHFVHISDDTQLWDSSIHYKHDLDIGIMMEKDRRSAWLRNFAPCKSAIVSNLSGVYACVHRYQH